MSSTNTAVFPGLIDCHVHFREPGLEHKATIATEARASRSGGIFTVCEMPNTNPGTNTLDAMRYKVGRAKEVKDVCDVRFFFGATTMDHLKELDELFTSEDKSVKELAKYCCGLKLYLDNSTGDMKSSEEVTDAGFALCTKLDIVLVAHCEHAATNDDAALSVPYCCSRPVTHSQRRPAKSEVTSILEAISLARKHRTRLHIAHLSTSGGLAAVKEAKQEGLRVTCETTPHHLFLFTDDYATLSGRAKVNPPLRFMEEREALWDGLVGGDIDCIATDHAPHLLAEKDVDGTPPSGLPGVEVSLSLFLSVALGHWPHPSHPPPQGSARFTLDHIQTLMFAGPNRIFRLEAPTAPKLRVTVSEANDGLRLIKNADQVTKCKWTPYDGWSVKGAVVEI